MSINKQKDTGLDVKIENGKLVISIGVNCLANAIELGPDFERYDENSGEFLYPKVTDPDVFAVAVLNELERESEDGTTRVHLMLDGAAREAIEQGAEGVEIP